MREVGIGILGFGTVGAGVVDGLTRNADVLTARLGARTVVRAVADLDTVTDRGVAIDRSLLTTDALSVIRRPDVDVVVELIGGVTAARRFVVAALEAGKPVVTANKALLAEHGAELFDKASEKGCDLYFGAAVGGGIPIVRALREGLVGNRILSIHAILNGTCNYILTRMEREGLAFADALKEAQRLGYAEADPSLDIDGIDTAHKMAILAAQAFGFCLPFEAIAVEGIRGIDPVDIRYAGELGYRIKLLGVVKCDEDGPEVRVHPSLVPLDHMLASVSEEFNAVLVQGDLSGHTLYYGRGAGRFPTASTVIADIADLCRNRLAGARRRVPPLSPAGYAGAMRPADDLRTRYYMHTTVADKVGVLAQLAATLGRHGISIASAMQREARRLVEGHVPVVILTHTANECRLRAAVAEVNALACVGAPTVCLRIED